MYATAGNLDDFLLTRAHAPQPSHSDTSPDEGNLDQLPRAERIMAFKKRRQSGISGKKEETRAVLLLGLGEIVQLFSDIVEGLAFLVRGVRPPPADDSMPIRSYTWT